MFKLASKISLIVNNLEMLSSKYFIKRTLNIRQEDQVPNYQQIPEAKDYQIQSKFQQRSEENQDKQVRINFQKIFQKQIVSIESFSQFTHSQIINRLKALRRQCEIQQLRTLKIYKKNMFQMNKIVKTLNRDKMDLDLKIQMHKNDASYTLQKLKKVQLNQQNQIKLRLEMILKNLHSEEILSIIEFQHQNYQLLLNSQRNIKSSIKQEYQQHLTDMKLFIQSYSELAELASHIIYEQKFEEINVNLPIQLFLK